MAIVEQRNYIEHMKEAPGVEVFVTQDNGLEQYTSLRAWDSKVSGRISRAGEDLWVARVTLPTCRKARKGPRQALEAWLASFFPVDVILDDMAGTEEMPTRKLVPVQRRV